MDTMNQVADKAKRAIGGNNTGEGATTKSIEKVTAAIPSGTWLVMGGGAIVASLALKMMGKHTTANFVGQWVPAFLMLGLYNKIVKVMGSDRQEQRSSH